MAVGEGGESANLKREGGREGGSSGQCGCSGVQRGSLSDIGSQRPRQIGIYVLLRF